MRNRSWRQIATGIASLNALSEVLNNATLASIGEITFYIVFGAGTTAGAIQIESAHDPAYTGIWASEGSPVAWVAANRVHTLRLTGYSFTLRARVSTLIANGTVDIYVGGQG